MQNSGEKGKNLDEKKRSGLTNQIAFQRLIRKQTRSRTYFLLQYVWKIIPVQPANDLYLSLYLYFARPFPVDKKEPGEGEDGGGKGVQEAM